MTDVKKVEFLKELASLLRKYDAELNANEACFYGGYDLYADGVSFWLGDGSEITFDVGTNAIGVERVESKIKELEA